MAIISSGVIENSQRKHGQYRVRLQYDFDDGRSITVGPIQLPLSTDAAQTLLDREASVISDLQKRDSEEVSEIDTPILAYKQADIKQVALAYLRKAYRTGNPYQSYLKFKRFDDYRVDQGWSLGQVTSNLASVGLTSDEWTLMKNRYQYLSNTNRVLDMEVFQTILAGDTWGRGV